MLLLPLAARYRSTADLIVRALMTWRGPSASNSRFQPKRSALFGHFYPIIPLNLKYTKYAILSARWLDLVISLKKQK